MDALFLGFDCGTQSLKTTIIDYQNKKIIYEDSVHYDSDLPHYQTKHGVLHDGLSKTTPSLLFAEALDMAFERMIRKGLDLTLISAVSGSAQQHGSVYLNERGKSAFKNLNPNKSLKENFENGFSKDLSPIWMDASTSQECLEIEKAVGGSLFALKETGSSLFERFTGPQIRKFFKEEPASYKNTGLISLISGFMSSILSGSISPIDTADGSGMNLMSIEKGAWSKPFLEATADHLLEKLPPLSPSWRIIGEVSPYFTIKYGLNPKALAIIWSGDNPDSLLGLGIAESNVSAISLGTSFTYFGHMDTFRFDEKGEGHVFRSPDGHFMTLNCFKNGALAIEKMRSLYSLDLKSFENEVLKAKPGNDGKLLLPFFETEIVPKVLEAGVHRFHLNEEDVPGNCRALLEAEMLSMKVHSAWMGKAPTLIYATGGASKNKVLLQIMADVFNASVIERKVSNSACLGACLRAAYAYFSLNAKLTFKSLLANFFENGQEEKIVPKNPEAYHALIKHYADLEESYLNDFALKRR
ncbi:xylulokinase [Criblamydia sequanensis]|uniref:Xylulose kinase n=1 Tax=Candidatus Criblamydia sequanensis CRIB-18 TaxID=1437425 RepID=A0A090DXG3_9BACT|nr:FGGY family carbohydrate kinase [Criblamydia sequanensis]CDR33504.1 putative xylulose kinase [Criblamydia sequanensis CRIB-18]